MIGRRGFTLAELLVSMVIMGIIGVAITKLFVSQSRFYDQQAQLGRARLVSRTAINATLADLRMTEATGGVVAASPTSITVRVPYALGVVCNNTLTHTTVALFPVDSTTYATAGFTSYAWRDSTGRYRHVEAGATVQLGADPLCTAANVTVLPQGKVIAVQPPLPSSYPAVTAVGTPLFLAQRVTYEFKASVAMPGHVALWRTVTRTGQADELVAPFDSTARFRFFVQGSDNAQAAVPSPLSSMRGLQLHFNALSDRAPRGSPAPKKAQVVTAVFFNNHLK